MTEEPTNERIQMNKAELSAWSGAWVVILMFLAAVFLIFGPQGCATVGKNSNSPMTYSTEKYDSLKGKDIFEGIFHPKPDTLTKDSV